MHFEVEFALPYLDYEALKRDPKIIIGYSVEIGQQGVGVAAANHRHDCAHLWIPDEGIELFGPRRNGAGAPVIPLPGQAARLEFDALRGFFSPSSAATAWAPNRFARAKERQ